MKAGWLLGVVLALVGAGLYWAWPRAGGGAPAVAPSAVGPRGAARLGSSAGRGGVELGGAVGTEAEGGAGRASVAAGEALRVTDGAGRPIAGAVLAVLSGAGVVQVVGNADGEIALAQVPRSGRWVVGAPGYDFAVVPIGAGAESLWASADARLHVVDVRGRSRAVGRRVRWLVEPALRAAFPWIAQAAAPRVGATTPIELGPLPSNGLDGGLGFECALDGACTFVARSFEVELNMHTGGGAEGDDFGMVLPAHAQHPLPQLVFRDGGRAPLVGAEVELWVDDVLVREGVTDAAGAVAVDFHVVDEDQYDVALTVVLRRAGTELRTVVDLPELRAAGQLVFDESARTVRVRMGAVRGEVSSALERAAALARLEVAAVTGHTLGGAPAHTPSSAELAEHLRGGPELDFHPLPESGDLELGVPGFAERACLLLRDATTGILVGGACRVPLDVVEPVVLPLPAFARVRVVVTGPGAASSDWRVLLTPKSNQTDELVRRATRGALVATRARTEWVLPQAFYSVELTTAAGYRSDDRILAFDAEVTLELALPELRTVRGSLRRRLVDAGYPDSIVLNAEGMPAVRVPVNAAGRFVVTVPASADLAQLVASVELAPACMLTPKGRMVGPDTFEFAMAEATLTVDQPNAGLGAGVRVHVMNQKAFRHALTSAVGQRTTFTLAPGEYSVSCGIQGYKGRKVVELAAGEDASLALSAAELGGIDVVTDAPVGAVIELAFFEAGHRFRAAFTERMRVNPTGARPQELLALAGHYDVRAEVTWTFGYMDSLYVTLELPCEVPVGRFATLEVRALGALRQALAELGTDEARLALEALRQ